MKKAFKLTKFDLSTSTHKLTDNLIVLFYRSKKETFPTKEISLINQGGIDVLFVNTYLINIFKIKESFLEIDNLVKDRHIYIVSLNKDCYFKFYLKHNKNVIGHLHLKKEFDEEKYDEIMPYLLSKNNKSI